MPKEPPLKQDRQNKAQEQKKTTAHENNTNIPMQLVDKYRLLLGKTIKTSYRFRRIVFKVSGQSLPIGGSIDGNTVVSKKMFRALAKKLLGKHKIKMDSKMKRELWSCACRSKSGAESNANLDGLSCAVLEHWMNISPLGTPL